MESHSHIIKREAKRLGFDYCGISKAEFLEDEAKRFENWLHSNMQGKMSYMERYADMRLDPRILVPGAKSVRHCRAGASLRRPVYWRTRVGNRKSIDRRRSDDRAHAGPLHAVPQFKCADL